MLKLLIIFLVLLPIVISEDFSSYTSVTANVNIEGEINLAYTDSSSNLDYFDAKVHFFPVEYLGQEVRKIDVSYTPSASTKEEDGILNLRWNEDSDKLTYTINTEVTSKSLFRKIDKKIPFPVGTFSNEYDKYLGEKEFADINRDIRDTANNLVAGEDDFYEAVFKIAEWTRSNIEYDLNTLTEKAVQKSSWVLKNRFGVCDELTNLFTSMVRSIGIPVKYVTGLAHSDVVGGWSPHAWNEVYFPEVGWIPFDITFGQYGWIDPGHIKMMEGEDAHEPSVEYFWRAVKVGIESKNFEVNASLKEKGEKFSPLMDLNLEVLKNSVGEDSYVPIKVTVKNLQPFYLSSLVFITSAPNLVGDNIQVVLLKPFQEKKVYWLLNISEKLDAGFKYESIVEVRDSFGSVDSEGLILGKGLDRMTFEEANTILNELIEKEESIKDYDLSLECNSERDGYFRYENLDVNCSLKNKGNVPLSFSLCLENDCRGINLGISDVKEEKFEYPLSNYSDKKLSVKALGDNLDIEDILVFRVYDKPVLHIEEINYNDIKYDESGNIEIVLNIIPFVDSLEVYAGKLGSISLTEVGGRQKILIPFRGWDLNEGENIITININYKNNGDEYEIKEEFLINIIEVSSLEKFLVLFKKLLQ